MAFLPDAESMQRSKLYFTIESISQSFLLIIRIKGNILYTHILHGLLRTANFTILF